ncbi:hypothetical protein FRC09_001216 [Ceratobasidium sp. 395]|nr:hypothetical protein FRC09_001216 [Ceratobasidium sp. 395]
MSFTDAKQPSLLNRLSDDNPNSLKLSESTLETPPICSIVVPTGEDKLDVCADKITELQRQGELVVVIGLISLEEMEELYELLSRRGLKFRFDWDSGTLSAYVRMPAALHTIPLINWVSDNSNLVRDFILGAAKCRKPVLLPVWKSFVTLRDRSVLSCDAGWAVYFEGDKLIGPELPLRVVFEIALTQPFSNALDKSWKFLWTTKVPYQIHAVVILNVENLPAHGDGAYKVTMQTWVRDARDNVEASCPLDDCPPVEVQNSPEPASQGEVHAEEKPSPADQGELDVEEQPAPAEHEDNPLAVAPTEFWRSNETTRAEDSPRRYHPKGEDQRRIRRREKQVVIVYDEALGGQQKAGLALRLDAYDLLRVCNSQPENFIEDDRRLLSYPVETLQRLTHLMVRGERQEKCATPPPPQQSKPVRPSTKRVAPTPFSELLYAKRRKEAEKPNSLAQSSPL